MRHSTGYIFLFAGAICIICAIVVCSSEVSLSELHKNNARLDKQKNILYAAGLARSSENLSSEDVQLRFGRVKAIAIHVEDGELAPEIDPDFYDARKAAVDPKAGRSAPPNASAIKRMARHAIIYHILEDSGEVGMIVLPIEGYGLWGTLYGFLALDADAKTVRGLTYYQHKETPGLGGEVDNPDWKALWPDRVAFDESGEVAIEVIKGQAGLPVGDPHRIDGLSGATITSRGVTNMLHFWLGEDGFGPYLKNFTQVNNDSIK
ncbi:MAG: Na(+)-translocating NADH-quinone reductase subunit C [Solibacterales bacterium]|nr:Na(+)-translocating NADH-quinone reductase subunit C [Bryobacterales bacterium]